MKWRIIRIFFQEITLPATYTNMCNKRVFFYDNSGEFVPVTEECIQSEVKCLSFFTYKIEYPNTMDEIKVWGLPHAVYLCKPLGLLNNEAIITTFSAGKKQCFLTWKGVYKLKAYLEYFYRGSFGSWPRNHTSFTHGAVCYSTLCHAVLQTNSCAFLDQPF